MAGNVYIVQDYRCPGGGELDLLVEASRRGRTLALRKLGHPALPVIALAALLLLLPQFAFPVEAGDVPAAEAQGELGLEVTTTSGSQPPVASALPVSSSGVVEALMAFMITHALLGAYLIEVSRRLGETREDSSTASGPARRRRSRFYWRR